MDAFEYNGQKMAYRTFGSGERVFVWGHGWGHSSAAFAPLAEQLAPFGTHYVLDFPGFGQSPLPEKPWGMDEYAAITNAFIASISRGPCIWIGHSFGCRVGLMLGAHHMNAVSRMVFIAGAGLPLKASPLRRLYVWGKIRLFKTLKWLARSESQRDALRARFGSADYRNAGPLRPIFINVVNRDLTPEAKAVSCPVRLIYGANDTETPPVLGERFAKLIPHADLHILTGQDHYTVLGAGQQRVLPLIKEFVSQ